MHPGKSTEAARPEPRQPWRRAAGAAVVGLPLLRTACAFSSRLRGLELVPSKRRHLVPPMLRDGYPYPLKRAFGKHAGQAAHR